MHIFVNFILQLTLKAITNSGFSLNIFYCIETEGLEKSYKT